MRVLQAALVFALLHIHGYGQAGFETAEIRSSPHLWNAVMQGGLRPSGRYELRQATLMDMIRTAYAVDADTVFGPPWLDADRFDITAKAPAAINQESARLMLRNLLADRFQLAVHEDRRPLPGFVLARGKGQPKLKPAEESSDPTCRSVQPPKPTPGVTPYIVAYCRGVSMETFAGQLRALSFEYVTGPVVESTGLKGAWDFDLQWTPRGPLMGGRGGISLSDAVDRQLGLKLEAQKIPMPVLVVDRVNRKPRETTARPVEPLEFEVASIRASRSDEPGTPPHLRLNAPGGRVTWRNVPLRDLVRLAWDLDPDPHAEIAGAPRWLESEHFDLIAKAPASSMASSTQIFADDLQKMLRALLTDRFRMSAHYEDRPADIFSLTAVKPKLKPADPSNHPGCVMAPPQPPREPGEGPPPRIVVCRNVTMAYFAGRLQDLAKSYLRHPVIDDTGLDGSWDFTLTFHPAPPADGGKGKEMKEGTKSGEEGPRISIYSAIEKELGLKLKVQRRPTPVLVLDRIQQKPTEN